MAAPPLILLHGALGSQTQFAALKPLLAGHFSVYTLDFSGHGGQPVGASFSVGQFMTDLLAFFDHHSLPGAHLFGYSMGGYVALLLAAQHPARVGKVMTLGTKFDWNPTAAAREAGRLDPEVLAVKVPAFAEALHQLHRPDDWQAVVRRTAQLMRDLGDQPPLTKEVLAGIDAEVRICWGSADQMVSQAESAEAASHIPRGQLVVAENFPHPLEKTPMPALADLIVGFMGAD